MFLSAGAGLHTAVTIPGFPGSRPLEQRFIECGYRELQQPKIALIETKTDLSHGLDHTTTASEQRVCDVMFRRRAVDCRRLYAVSVFEFVVTLYSIVVALAVARLLGGFVALIEFRDKIVHRPLLAIWLSLLLLGNVAWWFSLWNTRNADSFTLLQALFTFHVPVFVYVACHLLVPSETAGETMSERFFRLRIPFLVCASIPFIVNPLIMGVFGGDWSVAAFLLPIGGMVLAGTISGDVRFQYVVVSAAALTYVAFAVQLRSAVGA